MKKSLKWNLCCLLAVWFCLASVGYSNAYDIDDHFSVGGIVAGAYQYADPDLEALSSGQRILLRIGKNNATRIKAKLRDIKQELLKHMHEEEVKPAR